MGRVASIPAVAGARIAHEDDIGFRQEAEIAHGLPRAHYVEHIARRGSRPLPITEQRSTPATRNVLSKVGSWESVSDFRLSAEAGIVLMGDTRPGHSWYTGHWDHASPCWAGPFCTSRGGSTTDSERLDGAAGDRREEKVVTHQPDYVPVPQETQNIAAERRLRFILIARIIWAVLGFLEALLGLRFLLKVIGANPASGLRFSSMESRAHSLLRSRSWSRLPRTRTMSSNGRRSSPWGSMRCSFGAS